MEATAERDVPFRRVLQQTSAAGDNFGRMMRLQARQAKRSREGEPKF